MEAGSTRPRSKSGSSADSASANEESHLSKNSPQKQRNGTSAPTTTRPPSTGNSPARKQDSNYSTESRGRDTRIGDMKTDSLIISFGDVSVADGNRFASTL